MSEKTIHTRIQLKNDTEANWNLATNFIPKLGEVIVYNVDANNTKPRLKIGDGVTTISNLPFISAEITYNTFTGKPTADQAPAFGGTFTISQIAQDSTGQISGTDRTITIPSTTVSSTSSGLAPKGASVSTQSQNTKFLREDGTWSAPSYTTNTDRYVNLADFSDDTSQNEIAPVLMTLIRAGSDTERIYAHIPRVASTNAGVVPKGNSVSTQSQSTKFLREDGHWATPSYSSAGTDEKVKQHETSDTASGKYNILFSYSNVNNSTVTEEARKHAGLTYYPASANLVTGKLNDLNLNAASTGFTIAGGTTSKTLTVGEDYTLAAACAKSVDSSISAGSSSMNLPTSAAVASFVEGKGYKTTDANVTQTATTTSAAYEILFSGTADNTTRTEGTRKTSTLTYNPNTKALSTGGTINTYTLADACEKSVDSSISSSSNNLPTSAAVFDFVRLAFIEISSAEIDAIVV